MRPLFRCTLVFRTGGRLIDLLFSRFLSRSLDVSSFSGSGGIGTAEVACLAVWLLPVRESGGGDCFGGGVGGALSMLRFDYPTVSVVILNTIIVKCSNLQDHPVHSPA